MTELAQGAPAWLVGILDWVHAHPLLAMAALALACGIEGLFLIGLVIPGSLLMLAAGAIIAAGDLPLTWTLLCAAIGAWLGDCASFAIGRRFRGDLHHFAARLRMPNVLHRGEQFFRAHGGKSVFLGRFIGPLRPLVPAVAGSASMAPLSFAVQDLVAAILWAVMYALPGLIVGTTLSLAAEVATRLALLMGLVVVGVWLLWWLISHAVRATQRHGEPVLIRLMDWSHRHRRLGNLGPALADPDQPETPVLAGSAVALTALGALIGYLLWPGDAYRAPALDEVLYESLASLHSDFLLPLAGAIATFGETHPVLLLFGVVLAVLVLLRRPRATAHWIATLAAGVMLGLAVPGGGVMIGPSATLAGPTATTLALTLLGSLAGILATHHSPPVRTTLYVSTGVLAGLLLSARLALGWLSGTQALLALLLALTWAMLLTLGFRRHLTSLVPLPLGRTLVPLAVALLVIGDMPAARPLPEPPAAVIDPQWIDARPDRINLFWHGDLDTIRQELAKHGWSARDFDLPRDLVRWLLPDATPEQLPPAPQLLAGHDPTLQMMLADNGTLHVLRLWPSPGPDRAWTGHVATLVVRNWLGLLNVPVTRLDPVSRALLREQMGGTWAVEDGPAPAPRLILSPAAS